MKSQDIPLFGSDLSGPSEKIIYFVSHFFAFRFSFILLHPMFLPSLIFLFHSFYYGIFIARHSCSLYVVHSLGKRRSRLVQL